MPMSAAVTFRSLCLVAIPLSFASMGRAEVSYRAPEGCPSRDAFLDAAAARWPRVRDARERISVRVIPSSGQFEGSLEIQDAAGISSRKDVQGNTCDEVISALALVTALSVEREPRADESDAKRIDASEDLPKAAGASQKPRWHFAVGAQAALPGDAIPATALGGGVFADLSRPSAGVWTVRARVTALVAQSTVPADSGEARFRWMAARAEACPLAVSLISRVRAFPCLGVEGGVVDGEGRNIAVNKASVAAWWAALAMAHVEWRPWSTVFVDASGGLVVALSRDSFVIQEPRTVLHQASALSPSAGLGVGIEVF